MKFADLLAQFQQSVLSGTDGILPSIPDSPRQDKETLFDVYRDAYRLRLVGILRHDFERLHTFMGDKAFDTLAREFIETHPSHDPNARWYGVAFPEFVALHPRCTDHPVIGALAQLEGFLNDIFDAADTPPLTLDDLASFAPEDFGRLSFTPHPTARRIDTNFDLNAIWCALAADEPPPDAHPLAAPQSLLIWRQDLDSHFRVLGAEERMMWDEACKGVSFGVLCEMAATFDDPDGAPLRAAGYLQSWIASGLLADARLG
ncbi:MAG: putative DNA-binding domain-containing protein [Hyphomicrobiaceae bacterium]|nr:putative DNA-binding domain-containing protein [Hyphomicrobiaceae bacterium]